MTMLSVSYLLVLLGQLIPVFCAFLRDLAGFHGRIVFGHTFAIGSSVKEIGCLRSLRESRISRLFLPVLFITGI